MKRSCPDIPEIFLRLLEDGRWAHPGDDLMRQVVPCIDEPLVFLHTVEWVQRESCGHLADSPDSSRMFKEVRGSVLHAPLGLPWRDVEQSILIAINREIGGDVAIALDFRTGTADPRVIASAWRREIQGIDWVEVTPTFSVFLKLVGIR